MKIVTKILGIFGAIASALAGLFYILFVQSKAERKVVEKALEEEQRINEKNAKAVKAIEEAEKVKKEREKKDNEELEKINNSDNNLNKFNALNNLLQK